MYNLVTIMHRAWELRKQYHHTMATALRLAWAEAKGQKGYTFQLENHRASITAYINKLGKAITGKAITDEHAQHKYDILRAALLAPVDGLGIAVMGGKMIGLCKYAVRNA